MPTLLTRTDRNLNPTAMTTDVASNLLLQEGTDYTKGDPFQTNTGATLYTAKLKGDPYATTIKGLDDAAKSNSGAFITKSGGQRWIYANMTDQQWLSLTPEQKQKTVQMMYQYEGGKNLQGGLFTMADDIDKMRSHQAKPSDTQILNAYLQKHPDWQQGITMAKSQGSNDRDILNKIAFKFSNKNPTVQSNPQGLSVLDQQKQTIAQRAGFDFIPGQGVVPQQKSPTAILGLSDIPITKPQTGIPELNIAQKAEEKGAGLIDVASKETEALYGAYSDVMQQTPFLKRIPQAVGGIVGGLGGLIGGLMGGAAEAGKQTKRALTGKGFDISQIGKTAVDIGKKTAQFGYGIGEQGAIAAPLGFAAAAAPVAFGLPLSAQMVYSGTKQAITGQTLEDKISGALTAGLGGLGLAGGGVKILAGGAKEIPIKAGEISEPITGEVSKPPKGIKMTGSLQKNIKKVIPMTGKMSANEVLTKTTKVARGLGAISYYARDGEGIKVNDINEVPKIFEPTKANFYETIQAWQNVRDKIFNKYNDAAVRTGDKGAVFSAEDVQSVINELETTKRNAPPDWKTKVDSLVANLKENYASKDNNLLDIQEYIKKLNVNINPSSDKAGSEVASILSRNLRTILNEKILNSTGEQWQGLRNIYSDLLSFEGDIVNQFKKISRGSTSWFGSYVEGFGDLDIVLGLLKRNPQEVIRGIGVTSVKRILNYMKDPEVALKKIFTELEGKFNLPPVKAVLPNVKNLLPLGQPGGFRSQVGPTGAPIPLGTPEQTFNAPAMMPTEIEQARQNILPPASPPNLRSTKNY